MPKEWILNNVMNRFQLNFKRNVGPTSENIRKCEPKTIDEWRGAIRLVRSCLGLREHLLRKWVLDVFIDTASL